MIQNSNPGGLRPSSLPLGDGGFPQWLVVEKPCQFEDEDYVQHIDMSGFLLDDEERCNGFLSHSEPRRVEYNLLCDGRCNFRFVRSRWRLMNA